MSLKTKYIVGVGALVVIPSILLIGHFFLFGGQAYKAELAYSESSFFGKEAGFVVPASCNSSPPFSHFANDCPQMCELSGNPAVRNNTQYSAASNSCVCKNGKTNPPDCNLPSTEIAFKVGQGGDLETGLSTLALRFATTSSSFGVIGDGDDRPYFQDLDLDWRLIGGGAGAVCTASNNFPALYTSRWSGNKSLTGSGEIRGGGACTPSYPARVTLSCTSADGQRTATQNIYVRFENSFRLNDGYCYCNPSSNACKNGRVPQ